MKIYFNHKPLKECFEIFKGYDFDYNEGVKHDVNSMIETFKNYDVVVTNLSDKIDASIMANCSKTQMFINFAVGHDNLNKADAVKYNKIVANSPNCVTIATAEYTMALLFAFTRKLEKAMKIARENTWPQVGIAQLQGVDVYGKTVGIYGAGAIGKTVASFLKPYGVNFIYHNRNRDEAFERDFNAKYMPLDEMMANVDILLLHTPLTEQTKHSINYSNMSKMRANAIIVNMARGAVINTVDLIKILSEGKIAGAALDVYENEPNIEEGLRSLENVVLSPHIAGHSFETKIKIYNSVLKNVKALEAGQTPPSALK